MLLKTFGGLSTICDSNLRLTSSRVVLALSSVWIQTLLAI